MRTMRPEVGVRNPAQCRRIDLNWDVLAGRAFRAKMVSKVVGLGASRYIARVKFYISQRARN